MTRTQRWGGTVVVVLLIAVVAGCGAAVAPATPTASIAPPPAAATTATRAPATPASGASTSTVPVGPAPPTAAPPPATAPLPTRSPVGSAAGPTTAPAAPVADLWRIDGEPVTQVAIANATQRYVTTPAGLFALTGDQVERRATAGPWPNLVAAGPTTLISGERMSCGRGDGGVPLRRSVDGGRTWQAVQAGGGPLLARPVPTFGGHLFALACDGLYRSTDGGGGWTRLPILGPDTEPTDVATTPDGSRLYVVALVGEGGTTRLMVSDRQGDGWAPARVLREGWGGGGVGVGSEAGRPVLYAGSPLGVEVSRDNGVTWSSLNTGLDSTRLLEDPRANPLTPGEEAKLLRGVGVYSLAPRLDRPTVLLGGGDGVYRLNGAAWQKLPVLAGQIVRELFYDLDGTAYARTDVGVHRLGGI